MTISYASPSESTLPTDSAARVFTCTQELAYSCVRFLQSPGEPARAEEVVWRDGAFRYPYSVASSRVGDTYTVVRQGGWSDDLALHAEEAGAPAAAYLPADVLGFKAQYTLNIDRPSRNVFTADYSSYAHDLPGSNGLAVPDLVPGEAAMRSWDNEGTTPTGASGIFHTSPVPALGYLGEMSLVARCFYGHYVMSPVFFQYIAAFADYALGTEAGNACYSLVVGTGNPYLIYFAQATAAKTAILYTSTLAIPYATWFFVALRRAASGIVTLDLDGASQTSGALSLPTGGTDGRLAIGRPPTSGALGGGADHGLIGAVMNPCLIDRRLTDDEIAYCRSTMMGLS